MITRLLIIGLCAQFPFAYARATIEAATLVRQYDDGDTEVTSPSMDVDATFNNDRMKIGFGTAQDIVSSASSDVRTFASRGQNSKITDRRKEYSTHFETTVPDGTLDVGYIQSDENDYHSKTVTAGGTREFFQKNTVFGVGFANGQDRIQSSANKIFDEPMNNQVYSLSLTQVLSRLSVIQFIYDFRVESGYIASPYRRVKLEDGATITTKEEVHPRTRNRNALAVKYNYFVQPLLMSWATTYRFYTDSWEVMSHTIEERFSREFGKYFSAALILRYYQQKKASFFQDYYSSADPGPFHTGNKTLGTYNSILVGLRPQINMTEKISLYLKFEIYREKFNDVVDAGVYSTKADDKPLTIDAKVFGLGLNAKF